MRCSARSIVDGYEHVINNLSELQWKGTTKFTRFHVCRETWLLIDDEEDKALLLDHSTTPGWSLSTASLRNSGEALQRIAESRERMREIGMAEQQGRNGSPSGGFIGLGELRNSSTAAAMVEIRWWSRLGLRARITSLPLLVDVNGWE
jgi:hypothetical protein